MIVRYLKPEDENLVDAYAASHKDALIYHTTQWKRVIEKTYGYKPAYLLALENDRVHGLLPLFIVRGLWGKKRLVSLPYSHMVQPICEDETVLAIILSRAEEIAKKLNAEYIQLKCELKEPGPKWEQASFCFDSRLGLGKDIDAIFKKFKSNTRRNIKKAQKSELSIHIGRRPKDFEAFYDLIVETRKRQGAPPYSKAFFLQLYEHLDPKQMQLYLASYKNRPIAGIIMLYHGLNAIYAYGASVSDRTLLQMRPNDLLFWNVIKDAWQNDYQCFDFGITPFHNRGLLRFKSQWGTIDTNVQYTYYLNRVSKVPVLDRSGRLGTFVSSMFRFLPRSILKAIGPIVLKLLG